VLRQLLPEGYRAGAEAQPTTEALRRLRRGTGRHPGERYRCSDDSAVVNIGIVHDGYSMPEVLPFELPPFEP
jgi:hypothetical protein